MNKFTYIDPSEDFAESRNNGIGASDIPILCGESSYMTPIDLWLQKTGKEKKEPDERLKKRFESGHLLENISIYRYLSHAAPHLADDVRVKHILNKTLKKTGKTHIFTRFQHNKHKFMFCHPDLIHEDQIIEIKNYQYKGDFNISEELSSNDIPFKYYLQIQYQMFVTGLTEAWLSLTVGGFDYYEYGLIEPNEKLFEVFEKLVFDFWQLVQKKIPPKPKTRSDIRALFPEHNFKSETIDGDLLIDTILQKDRYSFLKKRISSMKKEQDKIKNNVILLLSKNNVLQTPEGEEIAKLKEVETERIKSLSKIKKENPEMYQTLKDKNLISITKSERLTF